MLKKFRTLPLCAVVVGCSALAGYCQTPQNLTITTTSTISARTPADLGVVGMHQTNGTTVGTGTANVAALNAWTTGGGWRARRGPLSLNGWRIGLGGTAPWDMGPLEGFGLIGTGLADIRVESQFGGGVAVANNIGGQPSGFVWVDKSNLTGPMLLFRGGFWNVGSLNLWGNFGTGLLDTLKADLANRKALGLEVRGRAEDVGIGTGKIEGDIFVGMCVTAIKTTIAPAIDETPVEDNADESYIKRLRTPLCDVGLHLANMQSISWRLGYFDAGGTITGVILERGGSLHIAELVCQTLTDTGVRITGNDTVTSGDVTIDKVQVDDQVANTFKIIHVNTASGANAMTYNIGHLRGDTGRPINNPYFVIESGDSYGELNINSGDNLIEGMIEVKSSSLTFPFTVRLQNGRFWAGDLDNIRKLFTPSSRGYINVLFRGCREGHNFTPGQTNEGRFFNEFLGRINITGNGSAQTVDWDVVQVMPFPSTLPRTLLTRTERQLTHLDRYGVYALAP